MENKTFNLNEEIELEVYGEICCDYCHEIIHNHIDCPVCKTNYSPTNKYCELYDETELMCEKCGTTFFKTSDSWYYDCKVKIIKTNPI